MKCETYLHWVERQQRRPGPPVQAPEKAESLSETEMEHWLREFGDLDDDPTMKELFNPYDFE
jgi:hypothetical protein